LFQQAIDRQDRTQVEGRFNYWNYRRYHYSLKYRNTPPDKDSSNVDDMPCRHTTPLRLHTLQDTISQRHLAGDRLRIAIAFALHLDIQDYSHQDYRTSRTTNHHINHRLLGKTTEWEPISYTYISLSGIPHLATNPSTWSFHCLRFMYNPVLLVVLLSMRSHWQPNCITAASIMKVFVFSLYSLFLQYTPNY